MPQSLDHIFTPLLAWRQRMAIATAARVTARFPRAPALIALARLDRPIGIYLLLWPTLWGLWLAARGWPGWHLLIVFTLGVALTRSAGCIMNDFADRHFDGRVQRTRERPLATGVVSVREAFIFVSALLAVAFALVLTTNGLTVALSFGAVAVGATYPYMKRVTYMPQAVLGVAFAWGIPMAYAAVQETVPREAWLLFVAAAIWTVAYDTQYAMVDRDDDIKLGLRSSAILFGDLDRLMIGVLQVSFLGTMLLVGRVVDAGLYYIAGLTVGAALFAWQHYLIRHREREGCFAAFLNNHLVGAAIFAGVLLELAWG